MADADIVREWLAKADEDLEFTLSSSLRENRSVLKSVFIFNKLPKNISRHAPFSMIWNFAKHTI